MPFEMPDATARNILSQYCQITRVQCRCYAFAPYMKTGVRVFTITIPPGTITRGYQLGQYLIRFYVRYAGESAFYYGWYLIRFYVRYDSEPLFVMDVIRPPTTSETVCTRLLIIGVTSVGKKDTCTGDFGLQ